MDMTVLHVVGFQPGGHQAGRVRHLRDPFASLPATEMSSLPIAFP